MKKLLGIFLVLVSGFSLTGCFIESVRPSGILSTEEYVISGYHELEVGSAFDVDISFSDTEELISITADDNLFEYLRVDYTDTKLIIKLRNGINVVGTHTLKATISTAMLDDFEISGASSVTLLDPLETQDMNIDLSGASIFTGELSTTTLDVDISGASRINLSGSAQSYNMDASGASVANSYDFVTGYLNTALSGASEMNITVVDEIDANLSGGSTLRYKGPAIVDDLNLSGGSQIINNN